MSTIKTYSSTLNSTASLECGLKALAKYLYEEGVIKVETKWDPELKRDRTCYKINAVKEPEC